MVKTMSFMPVPVHPCYDPHHIYTLCELIYPMNLPYLQLLCLQNEDYYYYYYYHYYYYYYFTHLRFFFTPALADRFSPASE